MTKLNAARVRTDAKLRYAAIDLDELKTYRGTARADGSDWESAHQESFLFHLFGVRDGLLQEISLFHECDLKPRDVRKDRLRDRLAKMGIQSAAFRMLAKLEGMKSSWICIASRMRNIFTHQKRVPSTVLVHLGCVHGEEDGHLHLRDPLIDELKQQLADLGDDAPETLEEVLARTEWKAIRIASETDCLALFTQWHEKATKLVKSLRDKMPGAENG
jgi:hypothetical protein